MKKFLPFLFLLSALAYACAHYPDGDDAPPGDGGDDCGDCPDGQTCVDGTCTAPPDDGGGNPDGGTCTGNDCPTDGGPGGGHDGGGGGNDGGTGTCSCNEDCGCGQTCIDHACVQTSCCSDT